MSKSRVYGQQVQIFISDDGVNATKRLGEVMNFSYKATDVVKKHSSLGETGVGSIDVLDDGGTLSFELDKTDAQFDAFFAQLHNHLRGAGKSGKRGKAPYFVINMTVNYLDESTSTIAFQGTCLHDDEGSVSGRTEVFSNKFQGTYKKTAFLVDGSGEATDSAVKGLTLLSNAIENLNTLSFSTTLDYPETAKITDYSKV